MTSASDRNSVSRQQTFVASSRRRIAFTLVELLVVIGIIALLISILLPSLSKAREHARTVKCLANIKQICQAAYAYANENKGIWPPSEWWDGAPGTSSEGWPNVLVNAGYLNAPDMSKPGNDPTRSVFFCPSGNPDFNAAFTSSSGMSAIPATKTDMQGATARVWTSKSTGIKTYCWYGVNASTSGTDIGSVPLIRVCDDQEPAGSTNFSKDLTKLGSLQRTSELVFIFDGLYLNLTMNSARVNARHGRQTDTNLGFFDGHAATFKTADLPGGLDSTGGNSTDFSLAKLNDPTFYHLGMPKWRLNQN